MRLGLGQLAVGVCVALGLASACGGATDRSRRSSSDAGETGSSSSARGGAESSSAGRPLVAGTTSDVAGQSTVLEGGAPAASAGSPGVEQGGVAWGGEPATGVGMPAAGGEPSAAGAAGATAGAGGEAGAPPACCQPATCADILGGLECGTNRYSDGCGGTFRCDCANDLFCQDGVCIECDAGPDPCAEDSSLCGETKDACGKPIVCPDNCAVSDAQTNCYEGHCCTPFKTSCSADDCGQMLAGCGTSFDCTDTTCPIETECQPSGRCCKQSHFCFPGSCGYVDDGCGNYLDCGNDCAEGTVCLDNECHHSECDEEGLECGHTFNIEVLGLEWCGSCPQGEACMDNFCLPLCSALQ